MSDLSVGMPAPDFELHDQDGNPVRLSGFRGVNPVVLFFYPKDNTRVCTQEACAFRDDYSQFRDAGVKLFGISSDSTASHSNFARAHSLPYPLLTDSGGKVRRLFSVKKTWGLLPGRATFVIDRDGIVRHIFSSQFEAATHVTEALAALQRQNG